MPIFTTPPTDVLNRLAQELQTFPGCARWIVTLCTVAVLTAVFINFRLARGSRVIHTKRNSVVETGSMLAFFVLVYLLIRFRIGVYEIPAAYYPVAIAGLILVILGTTLNILGRFALGRNWGNQVIIYQDHTLVTGGVYRIVRHPLYAGLIWMFIGAALVFQNWAALAVTLVLFIPGMYHRGRQEEKALIAQFPGYVEYRNRTGMLFPISMGPEVAPVPKPAFAFCRISLTVMLWVALGLHNLPLVVAVFCILVLSVALKVQRSPMIQLYQHTILRLHPTHDFAFLDVPAMRFAHGMGAMMSLAVIVMILVNPRVGWYGLAAFCLLKTIAAFGFCPASKLFVCMRNGGCCALTRAAQG
jgi:protein-S-isoprenylcysteine O-methyltransferase Ste14